LSDVTGCWNDIYINFHFNVLIN